MREEALCCHYIGYSFQLETRDPFYALSHRQDSIYHGLCYTSRGALVGTRNSSMGPPHEGSIQQPIAPWVNTTTELNLAPFIHSIAYVWQDIQTTRSVLFCSGILNQAIFQPVVHNWFIKGCGMYCSVYGKVHIKDPLLLIEKSSLRGGSGFPSKKCVNVTIWMTSNNQW